MALESPRCCQNTGWPSSKSTGLIGNFVDVMAKQTPSADPSHAVKQALRTLAHQIATLDFELDKLRAGLTTLAASANPELMAARGVGVDSASALLVTAGGNPERMHSESAFASLCGASPIEASSGRTVRHRLNRGGDRQGGSP